jgi:glycosidase/MFS family permease
MFCQDQACSGWHLDSTTNEYYYHQFLKEQPDLNWRNPKVRQAMYNVMRFWLERGVAGFRVDAFAYLLEDPQFRDEPLNPDWHGDPIADGYEKLKHIYTENQAGLKGILLEMRSVLMEFGKDRMMIGEVYADNVVTEDDVVSFYGNKTSPLFSFPFNMNLIPFTRGNYRDAQALKVMIDSYNKRLSEWMQPNWVLSNHDVHRIRARVGDSESLTRCYTTLLLTLRGTPTIYNGDEFGQRDGYVPPGKRQDPTCKVDYKGIRCRDPERTPLQWTAERPNAGFTDSDTVPWLPVDLKYIEQDNVKTQLRNGSSFLQMTSSLLKLRQKYLAADDSYESFETGSSSVFGFLRGSKIMVLVNLGASSASARHNLYPNRLGEYMVLHNTSSSSSANTCFVSEEGTVFMAAESAVVFRLGCDGAVMKGVNAGGVVFLILSFISCCGVIWYLFRNRFIGSESYSNLDSSMLVTNDPLSRHEKMWHCLWVAVCLAPSYSYNTTIVSGVSTAIVNALNPSEADQDVVEGLIVSCILIGGLIGALIAPKLADRIGRVRSIVVCGLVAFFFSVALAVLSSTNLFWICVTRSLQGIASGMSAVLGPLYIAEQAPTDISGKMGTLYQINVCVFVLFAELINFWFNPTSTDDIPSEIWQVQFGLGAVFGFAAVFYGLFYLPEPPRRADDSEKRNGTGSGFCQRVAEIEKIWWILIFVLPAAQQLTGINAVIFYGPTIIKNSGFTNYLTITFLCIGVWNLASVISSFFLIKRLGRKFLMLAGLLGMSFSLMVMGITFLSSDLGDAALSSVALPAIMGFIFFFEIGPGPLFFILASESFPNTIRSDAIALSNAGTWIYNLIVAFSFPPLTTAFGNPKHIVIGSRLGGSGVMFIVFAFVSGGCAYVIWKYVHPAEKEEDEDESSKTMMASAI